MHPTSTAQATMHGRRDMSSVPRQPINEYVDDPLAVEAAVLDEDVSRIAAGYRAASDKQIGHVGLECLGIERRCQRLWIALDSGAPHEIDVRMIAGQQEHAFSRNLLARALRVNHHRRRSNLDDV